MILFSFGFAHCKVASLVAADEVNQCFYIKPFKTQMTSGNGGGHRTKTTHMSFFIIVKP